MMISRAKTIRSFLFALSGFAFISMQLMMRHAQQTSLAFKKISPMHQFIVEKEINRIPNISIQHQNNTSDRLVQAKKVSSLSEHKNSPIIKGYDRYESGKTSSYTSESEAGKNPPGVVWLASYPNSGTSYTLEIVRRASDYAIASNYGKEASKYLLEASIPIHPSFENGPFRTNDRKRETPEKFVLTKTHCGGRCVRCGPDEYLETEESFLNQCLSATPILESKSGKVEYGETGPYDIDLVKRAIHIIRDPFDNIVSRFHHAHKIHRKDESFQSSFSKNSDGFQKWCENMDMKYAEKEKIKWGSEIFHASRNVPCHAEFFRYIQWHNLSFSVLKKMDIPALFITYENYGAKPDFNLHTMLDFLELPMRNKASNFHQGDYSGYFSTEQRVAAMEMMSLQASTITWEKMKPYRFKVEKLRHEMDR